MTANKIKVIPEFSYSGSNGAKFLSLSLSGSNPIFSFANLSRKPVRFGNVYFKSFSFANEIQMYTLCGPYFELKVEFNLVKKALESNSSFKLQVVDDQHKLIEVYIPHSYIKWLTTDTIDDSIDTEHVFGDLNQSLVLNFVDKNINIKHTENVFEYVDRIEKHDTNFDHWNYS